MVSLLYVFLYDGTWCQLHLELSYIVFGLLDSNVASMQNLVFPHDGCKERGGGGEGGACF